MSSTARQLVTEVRRLTASVIGSQPGTDPAEWEAAHDLSQRRETVLAMLRVRDAELATAAAAEDHAARRLAAALHDRARMVDGDTAHLAHLYTLARQDVDRRADAHRGDDAPAGQVAADPSQPAC